MKSKIYTLNNLSTYLNNMKDKTTVLTNGCFDLLHIGHVRYLQAAKSQGDILIIGVNSDASVQQLKGPSRPINQERDRAEVLAALTCVDFVTIFSEATADHLLTSLAPSIYVKGGDYTLDTLPEKETIIELNIQTVFIPFVKGYSTTAMIEKSQN